MLKIFQEKSGLTWRYYQNIFLLLILYLISSFFFTACSPPPRVSAQERMFLDLSLEFLDSIELPKTEYKNTVVGGLSAITYDRKKDLFYTLSDDRSNRNDARFYTMKLNLDKTNINKPTIKNISFEDVTFLQSSPGKRFPQASIDPEGIAISPRGTLFISSEGDTRKDIEPFIAEFDLSSGETISNLPLPKRYLKDTEYTKGTQENLAFESLTVNQTGLMKTDPFRLFTATESSLVQDISSDEKARIRFLHYVINPIGNPILVAEHLYLLDPANEETISNGLTELFALKKEGYFLSLERTFGFTGAGAKIYQVIIGNATDTSNIKSLQNISNVIPLKKELLLDLRNLDIYLDNLEGMTIGPRLPDGSRSLILISDDNFNEEQVTQLLLFRLQEK